MNQEELVTIAVEAKEKAYAPYSHFRVGAALVTEDGRVFTGVNVENASFGATCCAERTAVFKAISEGCREIKAVAITSDSEHFTYPCGICRQVLAEFGKNDMLVLCSNREGKYKSYRLEELLPEAFREVK